MEQFMIRHVIRSENLSDFSMPRRAHGPAINHANNTGINSNQRTKLITPFPESCGSKAKTYTEHMRFDVYDRKRGTIKSAGMF